jgi:hypothetical protein
METVLDPTTFIMQQPLMFLTLIVWSLAWKGIALWQAARHGNRNWFIAILLINTIGILEIIYLYFILPRKKSV